MFSSSLHEWSWFRPRDPLAELLLRRTREFVMALFVFTFHSVKFLSVMMTPRCFRLSLFIHNLYLSFKMTEFPMSFIVQEGKSTIQFWQIFEDWKPIPLLALWVLKDNALKRESPVGGVFDFNFTDKDELDLGLLRCSFCPSLKAFRV